MYPSKFRLCIWIMFTVIIFALLLWDPQAQQLDSAAEQKTPVPAEVPVAAKFPQRMASVEEYALTIEELGQRKLAKKIYILTKTKVLRPLRI